MAQVPVVRTSESAPELKNFREAAQRHLDGLRRDADECRTSLEVLRTGLKSFETDLAAQKTRLDAVISQFQAQASASEAERTTHFGQGELARQTSASAAEDQRKTAFATAADERKAAFETFLAATKTSIEEVEKRIQSSEEARDKAASAAAEDQRAKFAELLEGARKDASDLSSGLKESAGQVIAAINVEREKAEKIVHVVGNTGMVGGYQANATAERSTASNWSLITVGAMTILVGVGLATIAFPPATVSWPYVGLRGLTATAVIVLATYAGRQAALHREEARQLRRTELELASIDPYLALLPEAERHSVKKLLAERYFGQPHAFREDRALPTDLAKSVVDTAKSGLDVALALTKPQK